MKQSQAVGMTETEAVKDHQVIQILVVAEELTEAGATVFKKLHIHYLTRVAAAKHMVLGIPHPIQAAIMAVTAVARIELDN
ncbi:hypothetical protein DXF93_13685 [Escherichia coli]|nr:hypothetical protein DXF93_13685 [Escherichia coli]